LLNEREEVLPDFSEWYLASLQFPALGHQTSGIFLIRALYRLVTPFIEKRQQTTQLLSLGFLCSLYEFYRLVQHFFIVLKVQQ